MLHNSISHKSPHQFPTTGYSVMVIYAHDFDFMLGCSTLTFPKVVLAVTSVKAGTALGFRV